LEASAGTGKTFAIEHVVVRLLLEGQPLHQILVVTFTRAATRELRNRILSNIGAALAIIEGKQAAEHLVYLGPWILNSEAIFRLANAMNAFDQAQIFTIHGFCQRILSEFPFEAGKWSLSRQEHPTEIFQKAIVFLKKIFESPIDVCPEQLSLCLHECDTLHAWAEKLLQTKPKENVLGFKEGCKLLVQSIVFQFPRDEVFADFEKMRDGYKKEPEDSQEQLGYILDWMERPEDLTPLRKLIGSKGTLIPFLDPQNKKVRAKEVSLQRPEFWLYLQRSFGPIVLRMVNRKEIFAVLVRQWHLFQEQNGGKIRFEPDDLLVQMKNALESPFFVQAIKDRFSAVIIDEFQDTDPLQWEIFQTLFLDAKTLYLVGDPKQSIYRFRNADVYTYLAAKKALGENNLYHLDTNFRSSKELLDALNNLFSRQWLFLPKEGTALPYHPVSAGREVPSLADEKKALHWMISGEEGSYRDPFLPYTLQEIQKLGMYKGIAVLVKDRYELQRALSLFEEYQIPSVARTHERLADTYAFEATRELFSLLASPFHEQKRKAVEMGPWKKQSEPWVFWQSFVQDKGLAKFFSAFGQAPLEDFSHVLEELFAWEEREGFSFQGIERFFQEFAKLEGKEAILRRSKTDEDAVQIMTLHMSKGLEFDVVFALALASTSPNEEEEEELNAEKLRQLYVAMTRAKKRLYVPMRLGSQEKSPIALFCKCIEKDEGSVEAYLETLVNVSKEFLQVPFPMPPSPQANRIEIPKEEKEKSPILRRAMYLESFTSLAKDLETKAPMPVGPGEFPQGKEVGTLIHEVFETIFQGDESVWKEKTNLSFVIAQILRPTFLAPWTEKIEELVTQTLDIRFQGGFSLRDLHKENLYPEMEFFYLQDEVPIKGFIDLVFIYEGTLYIVDWKTNLIESEKIAEVMQAHAYPMQASLYKEALLRHFNLPWGGAFYIFVRTGEFVHLC
jgi:exodeoxyribonuclease V beta subunit